MGLGVQELVAQTLRSPPGMGYKVKDPSRLVRYVAFGAPLASASRASCYSVDRKEQPALICVRCLRRSGSFEKLDLHDVEWIEVRVARHESPPENWFAIKKPATRDARNFISRFGALFVHNVEFTTEKLCLP